MPQLRITMPPPKAEAFDRRRVFLSHANEDKAEVRKFIEHFSPIRQRFGLEVFFEENAVVAGDRWNTVIQAAARTSGVFILFVSSSSLESDYCMNKELALALANERRGCIIVPVLLRECAWESQLLPDGSGRLSSLQSLPGPENWLMNADASQHDTLWTIVARGLAKKLETAEYVEVAPHPAAAASAPASKPRPAAALLPYLCDQAKPEDDVRVALSGWSGMQALVLLLRARSSDCPERFVDRIDTRQLKERRRHFEPPLPQQRKDVLGWPGESFARASPQELQDFFIREMKERVTGYAGTSDAKFVDALSARPHLRLFTCGIPDLPLPRLRQALEALKLAMDRFAKQAAPARLVALLWSEDEAILNLSPDQPLFPGDAPPLVNVPAALSDFQLVDIRNWARQPEVRRAAQLEREQLDAAFGDLARITMRQFVARINPLLGLPSAIER